MGVDPQQRNVQLHQVQLQVLQGQAEGGREQLHEGQQPVPVLGEGEDRVPQGQSSLEPQQVLGSSGLQEHQPGAQDHISQSDSRRIHTQNDKKDNLHNNSS